MDLMMQCHCNQEDIVMKNKAHQLIKIDKKFTPFLFNAFLAIKESEWAKDYDVKNYNIYINPTVRNLEGVKFYTITFLSNEINNDNWMDVGSESIQIKEINVDVNIDSKEVMRIYGGK